MFVLITMQFVEFDYIYILHSNVVKEYIQFAEYDVHLHVQDVEHFRLKIIYLNTKKYLCSKIIHYTNQLGMIANSVTL